MFIKFVLNFLVNYLAKRIKKISLHFISIDNILFCQFQKIDISGIKLCLKK